MAVQRWKWDTVPSRAELRREWGAKGFSCEVWVDRPGRKWLNFVHDMDELVLVIRGIIRLEVEGDVVELHPGDEALIPAHANHSVYNIGGTEVLWYFGYHSG